MSEFSGQYGHPNAPKNYNDTPNYAKCVSPDTAPESPSRIRDAVGMTEQALSAMHEMISMLEKRLDTVLRPVPPQGQSGPSTASSVLVCSHVTGRMNILNEGFSHAIQRLNEIGSRIEV